MQDHLLFDRVVKSSDHYPQTVCLSEVKADVMRFKRPLYYSQVLDLSCSGFQKSLGIQMRLRNTMAVFYVEFCNFIIWTVRLWQYEIDALFEHIVQLKC